MSTSWNFNNINNLGNYKTKITKNKTNKIDKFNYLNMQQHLNSITDTLFLPLSRGIRQPAIHTACIHFDHVDATFYTMVGPQTSNNFISGISHKMTVNALDYIDLTINEGLVSKSDIDPLFFVHNTSSINEYVFGMIPFPRVGKLIKGVSDITCRVHLETGMDIEWNNLELTVPSDWEGLSISVEAVFQSLLDNTDTHFFTPGIPYFEQQGGFRGGTFFKMYGYTYSDLLPDGSHTLWSSKLKTRYQKWDNDTSSVTGPVLQSPWESSYTSGLHTVFMDNLEQNSYYKIDSIIDANVGPDNFDWEFVAIIYSGYYGTEEPYAGG